MKEYEEILAQYMELITIESGNKYKCAGIYAIYIGDILVYIGKSRYVLKRIAEHMYNILNVNNTSNKYRVLRAANKQNIPITFSLLERVDGEDQDEIDMTIGELEGQYIRESLPSLNMQVPKEEDYHKFYVNKEAKTITLETILKRGF